jgi:hypothetical protein
LSADLLSFFEDACFLEILGRAILIDEHNRLCDQVGFSNKTSPGDHLDFEQGALQGRRAN